MKNATPRNSASPPSHAKSFTPMNCSQSMESSQPGLGGGGTYTGAVTGGGTGTLATAGGAVAAILGEAFAAVVTTGNPPRRAGSSGGKGGGAMVDGGGKAAASTSAERASATGAGVGTTLAASTLGAAVAGGLRTAVRRFSTSASRMSNWRFSL